MQHKQLPLFYLVGGFNPSENISQWEGLSHILWEINLCSKPPTSYCSQASSLSLDCRKSLQVDQLPKTSHVMVEVFLATAGTSPRAHQDPLCHGIEAAKNYQNTWWVTTVAPLSKCRNDPTFNFLRSSAGKVLRYGRLDFGEAGRTDQPQQSTNSQELYQSTHIIYIYIYQVVKIC